MRKGESIYKNIELRSLGLQNFQAFSNFQEIPIRSLTFIYGPNSSGKSALIDAIKIMGEIWGAKDSNYKNSFGHDTGVSDNFLRSIRRSKNSISVGQESRLCAEVSISSKELCQRAYSAGAADPLLKSLAFEEYVSGRENITVRGEIRTKNYSAERPSIKTLILSVGEIPLLQYDGRISINLKHPLLELSNKFQNHSRLGVRGAVEQVGKPGNFFTLDDGWLAYHIQVWINNDRKVDFDYNWYSYIEDAISDAGISAEISDDEVFEGLLSIGRGYNGLIDFFSEIIHGGLVIDHVPASRTIPTREDLTHLCNLDTHLNENWEDVDLGRKLGLRMRSDARYAKIAQSAAWRSILQAKENGFIPDREKSTVGWDLDHISRSHDASTLDRVNEALRDHLLLDRSYQITARTRFLVPPMAAFNSDGLWSSFSIDEWILAQLELTDPAGNRFSFDEVGSGIGYMLPVLVSINSTCLSVIEQPELHLHPALQGALGDVFIEAHNRGSRMVIESHSEHALLRALRRIRETASGKLHESTLTLDPSQLCVLYFEPQPTGDTRVRRLRVTPEGDFLDRWPGGFFAERDEDLFDE